MSRLMAEPQHHHHHPHAPQGPTPSGRVDTVLTSAGSRLLGVAVVCAVMWIALWLAVRAG